MASAPHPVKYHRLDPRTAGVTALLVSLVTATLTDGAESAAPASEREFSQHLSPSGSSALLDTGEPRAKPRKSRIIFACRSDAIVEFSDRPCDLAATSRSLEFTTGSPAGSAPNTKPREAAAATRPKTVPATASSEPDERDDQAREKKCATLKGQLDVVDSRMREGYSARDAAKLWNRWRDLKEELHSTDC